MSTLNDHKSRAHALLSASSSSRWLKCPPSAVAASLYPSQDTAYTREGTLAHEVAELIARGRLEDREVGRSALSNEGITAEMVRHAEEYADYIQEQIESPDAVVLLEQRLDFSPWVPEGFGTGDCLIIQGTHLDVIDYKYGQGVEVSAHGNSQMRLYGLGAVHDFGDIYEIETVSLHIFQPRKDNISVEDLSAPALLEWGEGVKPRAALAYEGKGEHEAGEHCRFCPHAGVCPALAQSCLGVYYGVGAAASVPELTPAQVAAILANESVISSWLKAVKDRALASMLDGGEVPGFKVVAGRGSRGWADELEVCDALIKAGYTREQITKTEVLSPAAMEKVLGKKKAAELIAGHILSIPGAPTVAPETDKRPVFDRLAEAKKDFE
jgi:hypothetical protein